MEESWAGLFRRARLTNLPVREFAQHVQDGIGRPTKELFTALGGQMRHHLNDLTDLETACKSDIHALIPAIESTEGRGLAPDEIRADSLYGSEENGEMATEMGVNVVSPTMGTPKKAMVRLSKVSFSDSGDVMACPEGHAPVTAKQKKGRYAVAFNHEHCRGCPLKADGPAQDGKKPRYLHCDDKARRVAIRRPEEYTDAFQEKSRRRSGSEAAMSEYERKTGGKRLRVRGFGAVRRWVLLKAISLNSFRATAVRKASNPLGGTPWNEKTALVCVILVFKERAEII